LLNNKIDAMQTPVSAHAHEPVDEAREPAARRRAAS